MLIFDKELKVLPAAGYRDPGSTFPATSPGPVSVAGNSHLPVPSSATPPTVLRVRPTKPVSKARCSLVESWSEG